MFKTKKFTILLLLISVIAVSCEKDDDNSLPITPVDQGSIFPNKLRITIIQKNDTTKRETYTFYDADGIGGNPPQILDTVIFPIGVNASQATYNAELEFFKDNQSLNQSIRNSGTKYVVCYREFDFFDLALNGRDKDVNGDNLGLNSEWISKRRTATGTIKISMNYNQQTKDGTCDAGSRVFEGYVPFLLD